MKVYCRILSLILIFVLLLSLSVFFVNAEESTDYFYIPPEDGAIGAETYGFKNSEYWDNVYVYASGGRSEQKGGMTYPGQKLEKEYVDGYGFIYTFSFAVGYYDTLLFNDGTTNNYRADLEKDFYDYCLGKLGEESLYEGAKASITDTTKFYDGTVMFTASSWVEPVDTEARAIIENYCVHRSATYSPYDLGVYVSTNDEIYTLEEALAENLLRGIPGDHELSDFEFHRVYDEDADLDLIHRCMYAFGDRYGYEPEEGESIYCEPYGYVGDYVLFHAYFSHYAYPAMNTKEQIGDYYFYNGMPCGIGENNSVALYVMNPEGEIFTLYEAYTQCLITDLEEVVNLTGGTSIFGRYGERIIENLGIDITAEDWTHTFNEVAAFGNGYSWSNTDGDREYEFVIVRAGQRIEEEGTYTRRAGKYIVISDNKYSDYDLGCYVYIPKLDTVFTFESAIERLPGLEDKIVRSFRYNEYCSCSVFGDISGNITVDINDATMIQKHVAGFYSLSENDLLIGDVNGDGELNVRDATMLQKHIAGLLDIYD